MLTTGTEDDFKACLEGRGRAGKESGCQCPAGVGGAVLQARPVLCGGKVQPLGLQE